LLLCSCAAKPLLAAHQDGVHHIVLVWLKQPGDSETRQRIIETSQSFAAIPGVLHVHAGVSMPSERHIVDDSFDVGITITFPDRAAMESYLVHPTHTHAMHEIIRPLVRKIVVYDFSE
jgi:hypothetical protein